MNTLTALQPIIKIVNHQPMTTSLDVARFFKRAHNNIMQAIKNLEVSEEFRAMNFQRTSYTDKQGKQRPMYRMAKNGFSIIGLGLTGKEAGRFKEAYIKAFDLMEEKLRAQANLAFLPAPPDSESQLERSRQDGFVRGLRFMLDFHNFRQAVDMDEQTLQTLCWYRSLGLTQDEAARLCIISRQECERIEKILRAHGCKTPVVNMSIRKRQILDCWAELVTQAGLSGLPAVIASAARQSQITEVQS